MTVGIVRYQEAYEKVISELKRNSQIAAVLVYGSIISGDIWENSDIDFLVITREKGKQESIYTKILDIPIHINYLSKDRFINSYNSILKGGSFHKAFFTGKLVFSNDSQIDDLYLSIRFYEDEDRYLRNIEILSHLLNSVHYTTKYLKTRKMETSFQWCVELLTNYSRLLLSNDGHITDKDILSYAVSMKEEVKVLFGVLVGGDPLEIRITLILEAVGTFINENLKKLTAPVMELLEDSRVPLSVEEIKNGFKQINGDISFVLEKMAIQGLILEGTRKYSSLDNQSLINEIVYRVKQNTK